MGHAKGRSCDIDDIKDFAIIVSIKQPLKDKSTDWAVRVRVDGRSIDGVIQASASGPVLESTYCEMTFHKGRRRMIGKLQFGRLVRHCS